MEKASFSKIEIWYPPEAEAQNSGSELVRQKVVWLLGQGENAAVQYPPAQHWAGSSRGCSRHHRLISWDRHLLPHHLSQWTRCGRSFQASASQELPWEGCAHAVLARSFQHRGVLILELEVTLCVCFCMKQILPALFGLSWRDRAVLSMLCPTPTTLPAPRLPP